MYYTYVVRPKNGPEGRCPKKEPWWADLIDHCLRFGFGIQFSMLSIFYATSMFHEGERGNFFAILNGNSKVSGATASFYILSFFFIVGSCILSAFRNAVDDDASIANTRGFRSGTKALCYATLLEIVAWSVSAMCLSSNVTFNASSDEASKFSSSGMIFLFARLLHVVSLMLYAGAIFLMEVYHTVGAGESWAWLIAGLFKLTAFLEIVYLVNPSSAIGTTASTCYLFALCAAFVWSLQFEKLVIKDECAMNQCMMKSEIYRSKNAMAYYGPQIDGQ